MNRPRTFFVNGHKCEVECVGREQWYGYLDGEKFTEGSRDNEVRNVLTRDAKYRVEQELDMQELVEAIYDFIERQGTWVTKSLITEEVVPYPDFSLDSMKAINLLKDHDCIRTKTVMNGLNEEEMYLPDLDDSETLMG